MKTIKFTVKNSKGSKNANFNFPDSYEKIFEKYEMEAYEFCDLFGKTLMNIYFRNKETGSDDGTFLINNSDNKNIFSDQISEVMKQMLEKMENDIE